MPFRSPHHRDESPPSCKGAPTLSAKNKGRETISIEGARVHNLKNIDIAIPRGQLVVITGVSGSGKSSLAIDTLYAEGQRQYIESLSIYARQYLYQLERPDVDQIHGLQPTLCIDQHPGKPNPRSSVATLTEIYDYLRLLYARLGLPHCPACSAPINQQPQERIHDLVMAIEEGARLMILAPLTRNQEGPHHEKIAKARKAGMVRIRIDGIIHNIDALPDAALNKKVTIEAVIDRVIVREKDRGRIGESLRLALTMGEGCVITSVSSRDAGGAERWEDQRFNSRYRCLACDLELEPIEPRTFSFNSPHGACPECEGMGQHEKFDPDLLLPDRSQSLLEGALASMQDCTASTKKKMAEAMLPFLASVGHDVATPFHQMEASVFHQFLQGDGKDFIGLLNLHEREFATSKSKSWRAQLEQFRGPVPCHACDGSRLCSTARRVTIDNLSIDKVVAMDVAEMLSFIGALQFKGEAKKIADPLIPAIMQRLQFLLKVGVGYLSLDRSAATLSGGELQRVRLAKCIGSGLVGACYVLDEPTMGLHPADNDRLIGALRELQSMGNTVVVVEHDASLMQQADYLIDIGPGAGSEGGEVIAQGSPQQVAENPDSSTGRYLNGKARIAFPKSRPAMTEEQSLYISGASLHNLQNIEVQIPLEALVCISGVSGSGKSSLINGTLAPAMLRQKGMASPKPGPLKHLKGADLIDRVIVIDQSPLGRSSRSNAASYTGLFDEVRKIFAKTRAAKQHGFGASRFSFNVKGGRCEACQGQGEQKLEMNFLPDLSVTCDACQGTRFNQQTLRVKYRDKSIADILAMSVEEGVSFFENFESMHRILVALRDIGLGYLPLGQPSPSLSGGEAQRIKLAHYLAQPEAGKTLYLLDEPTTGLHFEDIRRLLALLKKLVEQGNSVLVIEHNLDVIQCADWIIDMGPGGGDAGGQIIATGPPEAIAAEKQSQTGAALRRYHS